MFIAASFFCFSSITVLLLSSTSYAQLPMVTDPAGKGLNITQPSGSIWWVEGIENTLAWSCDNDTQIDRFTVVVTNKDPNILAFPQPFLANLKNSDCSVLVIPTQFTPSAGFRIGFVNPEEQVVVYTLSEEFEIRPAGSDLPIVTSTSIAGASPTSGTAQSGVKGSVAMKSNKLSSGLGIVAALIALRA